MFRGSRITDSATLHDQSKNRIEMFHFQKDDVREKFSTWWEQSLSDFDMISVGLNDDDRRSLLLSYLDESSLNYFTTIIWPLKHYELSFSALVSRMKEVFDSAQSTFARRLEVLQICKEPEVDIATYSEKILRCGESFDFERMTSDQFLCLRLALGLKGQRNKSYLQEILSRMAKAPQTTYDELVVALQEVEKVINEGITLGILSLRNYLVPGFVYFEVPILYGTYKAFWNAKKEESVVKCADISEIPILNEERRKAGLSPETLQKILDSKVVLHDDHVWIQEFFRQMPDFVSHHKNDKSPVILAASGTMAVLSLLTDERWKSCELHVVFGRVSLKNAKGELLHCILISIPKKANVHRMKKIRANSNVDENTSEHLELLGYCGERFLTSQDNPPYMEIRRVTDLFAVTTLSMKEITVAILSEVDARDGKKLVEIKMHPFSQLDFRKACYGCIEVAVSSCRTATEIVRERGMNHVPIKRQEIYQEDGLSVQGQRYAYHCIKKALEILDKNPDCRLLHVDKMRDAEDLRFCKREA
uniref:Protein kinase domain-containing protein n=1 Tax=Steinernema glaseri TaxID=37863 RepID=A0A1I7Y5W0_9BILA